MADPVSSVVTSGDSTTATTTVNFSAQTAGTLLTLHAASDDYKTGNPAGWTVAEEIGSAEGSFHGSYFWFKVSNGSETSVAYTIGSAVKSSYLLMVHTDIDTTTPKDVSAKQTVNSSGNNYTTPTSPTTSAGRKYGMAHIVAHHATVVFTIMDTWLNSYVEKGQQIAGGAGPFYAVGLAGLAFDGGGTTSSGASWGGNATHSRSGIIAVFNVATGGPPPSTTLTFVRPMMTPRTI